MYRFDQTILMIVEDFESDKDLVKTIGFELVDKQIIGGFTISLWFNENEDFYQIGLNVAGSGFATDQFTSPKSNKTFIKDFRQISVVIEGWLHKFNPIIKVGSMVSSKTKTYKKMLDRFTKLKTSEIKGINFEVFL